MAEYPIPQVEDLAADIFARIWREVPTGTTTHTVRYIVSTAFEMLADAIYSERRNFPETGELNRFYEAASSASDVLLDEMATAIDSLRPDPRNR